MESYHQISNDIKVIKENVEKLLFVNVPQNVIADIILNNKYIFDNEIAKLVIEDSKLVENILKYYKDYFENKSNTHKLDDIKLKLFNGFKFDNINIKKQMVINYSNKLYEFCDKIKLFDELYIQNNNLIFIPETSNDKQLDIFDPRINQQEAFDLLEKDGLQTGIHCQATGCGKSFIIIRYIDYVYRLYGKKSKIILFTERVNILRDMFGFTKHNKKADDKKINDWKDLGIGDLTNINIVNNITKKNKKWYEELKLDQACLVVINRAYLTLSSYKKISNLTMILHDECHNTTSDKCNHFLTHFNKLNVPIIGFSATPLRTGSNELKELSKIYGNGINLKLLTDYNLIYAISQDLVLPPEFFWYHVDDTTTKKDINDISQIELGTVLELLNKLIPRMPNKKIIAWCGTIERTKKWKKLFEENYLQRHNMIGFKFYMDTSMNENDDYEQFYTSNGFSILFCATKHREGSDIPKLDACIFLDNIRNRSSIPFIQSIGRVLRIDKNTLLKTTGFVIEGVYKYENYEQEFINKIIGYYFALHNASNNNESKVEKMIKIKEIIKFDKNKQIIEFTINDHIIKINLNTIHWDNLIKKFLPIMNTKIKEISKKITNTNIKTNFENINFTFSKILHLKINNVQQSINSYKKLIEHLYNMIGNSDKIIKNTLLNIKKGQIKIKGFIFNEKNNISFQGADANKSILEIYNQCKHNNIKLLCQIKLNTDKLFDVIV